MALQGFGGVLPWARLSMVERNRWLSDREFAELLAVGQVLPGPNIVNLSVMFGWRCAGWRGALAAAGGLIIPPLLLLLLLAALQARFSHLPAVQGALRGMLAVSAGLIIASGLKLALSLAPSVRAALGGVSAFVLVGLLRVPLAWVVLIGVPVALLLEWRAARRQTPDGRG